jgi:hypothetical protein
MFNQSGIYSLLFMAIDPQDVADSQYVNLEVIEAGNQYPRIGAISDRVVDEGGSLSFPIFADDPDSTIPILSVENLPANASFVDNHDGTGLFLWNPDFTQAGEYDILFVATDAEDSTLSVDRTGHVTVNNVNRAPDIDQIGPFSVSEGDSLGFLVTASDPDGTIPRLVQSVPLANSAFYDSGNGVGYFSFEPDFNQAGNRSVGFVAYDSEDSTLYDFITVSITVANTNRPPVLAPLPSDTLIQDGVQFVLIVSATDPDQTIPIMTANNLPENSSFVDHNDGTGTFTFTPDFGNLGEYFVRFYARDRQNSSIADSATVRIEVISTGMHPPQFQSVPTYYGVDPDTPLSIRMEAVDIDGDQIVISYLGSIPDGSVFADSGNGIASFSWTPTEADTGMHNVSFMAMDDSLLSDTLAIQIEVINWIRGDANGDGQVIGSDVTYLVNYFRGLVPRPYPDGRGDANADGQILGSDVTFLVNYFRGIGPPPPPANTGGGNIIYDKRGVNR